jgi:putative transposase
VCRFVYNFYIAHNKDVYEKQKRFISGMDFSKWLNNEFIPNNPDKSWIKDVGNLMLRELRLLWMAHQKLYMHVQPVCALTK